MRLSQCILSATVVFALASHLPAALVGYWDFNNAGNVGQAQVSDNLETVGNAAYSATGYYGGALSLDGVGDYLRKDAGLSLPTGLPIGDSSYTLAAWIRPASVKRNGIVGWGNFGTTGTVNAFRTGDVPAIDLVSYSWGGGFDIERDADPVYDGGWHHVATSYDSATGLKSLYLDGVQVGASQGVPDLAVAAMNFRIGATNHPFGVEEFNGLIDEMKIFDTALTLSEIQAAAVPESSTAMALLLGTTVLARRRKR